MLLWICWVCEYPGEGEVSVGQFLWNSCQSCWKWLWLLVLKHLLFSKGHSFSTPWAHMISWTVWIFLYIMVQIKCLWPSVELGYVWLPLKVARSTKVKKNSSWTEVPGCFPPSGHSSSLPTPAAKKSPGSSRHRGKGKAQQLRAGLQLSASRGNIPLL